MTPQALIDAVQHVLKLKAKEGKTTKSDAAMLVMGRIKDKGGPTKFGVGAALVQMAVRHIVEAEISRQLKLGLTDHEYSVLPSVTPTEILSTLGKAPRWIATSEGPDAVWQFSLEATAADWMANAKLKYKKAHQTMDRARESEEISRFLIKHKFECLAEAISSGV